MMSTNKNMNNSTEEWVPIKSIANNMITLDNNLMVAGVKIAPKNIFIMSDTEQYQMINGLKDFYNTLDFEFWLIAADRPVDISSYIAELQMMYNTNTNPIIQKLINQDLSKAEEFNDAVSDVEFYILFKERNLEQLQKKIRLIITGLSNAGMASYQANNDDLRSIIDNFLNGGVKSTFGTVLA